MSGLVEFILARVAEDEAVAKVRPPAVADWATWGPERTRVECEIKRRLIELVMAWKHTVSEDCWYTCGAATEEHDGGECCDDLRRGEGCDCGLEQRRAKVLLTLALPWREHPEFDAGWGAA